MHLIIKNGFSSKNTFPSTEESISLTLNKTDISGIDLNLYRCLDGEIVVSSSNCFEKIKLSEIPFSSLKKYHLKKGLKNTSIFSLEQLLSFYSKYNQCLVLTLPNHFERNKQYVEKIVEIINKYPIKNLYLKSDVKEIILYLKDLLSSTNVKIGAVMDSDLSYFLNLSLDFYVVDFSTFQKIGERVIPSSCVMIQNITSRQELSFLRSIKKNIFLLVDDLTYFKYLR